ncbi:uncharacterized protein [Dermacentor andersoni]|uniref:uncharacterized protein isoform X2 n=1 Tax=Dermacentor andersoni TaxID=34620 RepID=UPI0024178EAF|nr:prestalk protein-like isoform X2 [Dermacentor andersoni]
MSIRFALLLFCAVELWERARTAQRCSTDRECSRGRRCVPHRDVTIACRNASFCVRADKDTCDCLTGFTCRRMNCNKTNFECIKVKNLETRCHSYRGPYCSRDEICAYEKTELKCIVNCTCYGQYKAVLAVPHRCDDAVPCTTDADCNNQTRCVAHRNYATNSICETHKYCVGVTDTSCSCHGKYKCRLTDCQETPYECLILENQETRCGGAKGPKCAMNEYCAYGYVGSNCKKCPCYGSHQATCIQKQSKNLCSPDSIVRLDKDTGYTCDSCTTAASVLTGSA